MSRYTFVLPELKPPLKKLIDSIVNGFQQYQDLYKFEILNELAFDDIELLKHQKLSARLSLFYQ